MSSNNNAGPKPYVPIIKRPWFIPLVVLIVGGAAFYKFWLEEYLEYKSSMDAKEYYMADGYLYHYPNGRYVEEVKVHVENLFFEDIKREYEDGGTYLETEEYFRRFPEGAHAEDVTKIVERKDLDRIRTALTDESIYAGKYLQEFIEAHPAPLLRNSYDSLKTSWWQKFLLGYGSRDTSKAKKPEYYDFVLELVERLKAKDSYQIYVRMEADKVELKDYSEYSQKVKDYLDELTSLGNTYNRSNVLNYEPTYPLPSKVIPLSPKAFYAADMHNAYEEAFGEGLSESIKLKVGFSPFAITPIDDTYTEGEDIIIDLSCTIENLDVRMGGLTIPDLYTITESDVGSMFKSFSAYIFGIALDADLSLAFSDGKGLKMNLKSDPASYLYGLESNSSAYVKVAKSSFKGMGEELAKTLGF